MLKRYKRFLADIETPEGVLTAHCPNTGAMTGCAEPGSRVWYSLSDNPRRKYAATWEIVETAAGKCSVNTGRANGLVAAALARGVLDPLAGYARCKPEAAIPQGGGRFDFLLDDHPQFAPAYVEVKSVTLSLGEGLGAFPDAVSTRALKHVLALRDRVADGQRGVLIFCAQHCGIERVRTAEHIDPGYAEGLAEAAASGVEVLAYGCRTDLNTFEIDRRLQVDLATA